MVIGSGAGAVYTLTIRMTAHVVHVHQTTVSLDDI
jgi:hypothetical protein